MKFAIFKNLANPARLFVMIGISIAMFDMQYYFMDGFPGSDGFSCIEGANFTPANIIFAIVMSLLSGVMVAGIFALYKERKAKLAVSSASGLGVIIGSLTVFCTICTIPVISLFGFSIGLSAFTFYELEFKILSLILMAGALYLLNRQLNKQCNICVE